MTPIPYTPMTAETEQALARLARSGDASARETLILNNRRLAVKMANYWHGKIRHGDVDDFIGSAFAGLIHGIDTFDPDKGTRLSTHLQFWVRHEILLDFQDTAYLIRIPRHLHARMKDAIAHGKLDHPDTHPHVTQAERTRWTQEYDDDIDNPLDHRTAAPDEPLLAADRQASRVALAGEMLAHLAAIHPVRAEAVRHRFGVDGYEPKMPGQVAQTMGVNVSMANSHLKLGLDFLRAHVRSLPADAYAEAC